MIIPSSIQFSINDTTLLFPSKHIFVENKKISLNYLNELSTDSLRVIKLNFRTLSDDFSDHFFLISEDDLVEKNDQVFIEYDMPYNYKKDPIIQSNKMNYAGSFSRGFSVGNSQDLVLNSNLNLQLQGDLGDGLLIKATITDDNLPIQAQGNTQVLQEFEQVYIEISKNKTKLVAGDFRQSLVKNYFLKYAKKSKGVKIENQTVLPNNQTLKSYSSFAISRGKFNRLMLETSEGNQGPYRLEGGQSNGFYVVLSGTEKVFKDGVLLKRGFDQDYIIDYNGATIEFTLQCLIDRNARIIVEYEYADQSYLRTLTTVGINHNKGGWTQQVDYYLEQDSKTSTGAQTLDSIDLSILGSGGDNPRFLVKNAIREIDEENNSEVEYGLDQNGNLFFPKTEGNQGYRANFSFVGENQGNYIIDLDVNANGRVYKYIGANQGSYEPVIQLVAPQKRQYLNYNASYQSKNNWGMTNEVILNTLDKNRFSSIDDGDNYGLSWFGAFNKNFILSKRDTSHPLLLVTKISGELKHKNFQPLNPYRSPEFTRDWALDNTDSLYFEDLGQVSLSLFKSTANNTNYTFNLFNRREAYLGTKQVISTQQKLKSTDIKGDISYLKAKDIRHNNTFLRPTFNLKQYLGKRDSSWHISMNSLIENKKTINIVSDSLNQESFAFEQYAVGLGNDNDKDYNLLFGYQYRKDFGVNDNTFKKSLNSQDYNLTGRWSTFKSLKIDGVFNYRNLEVVDSEITNQTPKKTYLGKINYKIDLFNSGIKINSFAQYLNGQTAKFEDQYVQVQKGEGQYSWVDENQDSIQQVIEFRLADFQDQAEFIKVPIFNNEFIDVEEEVFNQTIYISPKKMMSDSTSFFGKSFLEKLFVTSRYKMNQKFQDSKDGFIWSFNPIALDSTLILYQSSSDHSIIFNQGNSTFDIKLGKRTIFNRRTQIYGFEQLEKNEWYATSRLTLKKIDFNIQSSIGSDIRIFEANPIRNMDINFLQLVPQISYLPNTKFRYQVSYSFKGKNNVNVENASKVQIHSLETEATWRRTSTSLFQGSIEYAKVRYDVIGPEDVNFVRLDLLEGLKSGNNFLWRIQMSNKLNKVMELNINYEGRKVGENRLVHLGNATIRAIF